MNGALLAGGVAVGGAAAFTAMGPVSWQRAATGLTYRVGEIEHQVPDLRFEGAAPCLLRPGVLARMRTLLRYTHELLAREGIAHWLTTGTLLGALRHRGFIPWDDDIDLQVPLTALPALLALRPRIEREGHHLYRAAGDCKLARGGPGRYPYVDLVMVAPRAGRMALCFPLDREGRPTFAKARQWPRECMREEELFPLGECEFEDLRLPVPRASGEILREMMGADVLTTVRHRRGGRWIHHLAMMTLFRLGLSGG